ncbi:26S proteasome non-ATPase regulatory subunit [Trichinella spiralis]|uniref:26S proteasome non-ATPase regulatory subunit n=1 Tax=Trichinella spiralis TaxID=6334 RepID=A0ABR3KX19_TRISP
MNATFVIGYLVGRHKRRCANVITLLHIFYNQQTHKYHINIAISGTCIRQPFTISYMLKFICMLKANKQICNSHVIESN